MFVYYLIVRVRLFLVICVNVYVLSLCVVLFFGFEN